MKSINTKLILSALGIALLGRRPLRRSRIGSTIEPRRLADAALDDQSNARSSSAVQAHQARLSTRATTKPFNAPSNGVLRSPGRVPGLLVFLADAIRPDASDVCI